MIIVLILADIVWIYLFSTAWEHSEEEEKKDSKTEGDFQFWDSLWFIHKIVYFLAYLELILKGFLLYYLIDNFKEKYKFKDLCNFNYDDDKSNIYSINMDDQQLNFDNIHNPVNESSNSYVRDFKNNY